MLIIIIGKNRAEYCQVKKKDLTRHFFTTRNQLYKIYPDALTPMETFHDGARTGSESVIIFEENATAPYYCKYPKDYEMDAILSSIDEHKLMSPNKGGIRSFFISNAQNGFNFKNVLAALPLVIVGLAVLFAMVV